MKIYHNPRCTKSRATLQLLQEKGFNPEVILYLENPPTKDDVKEILTCLRATARDIIRDNESDYKDNNLNDHNLSNDDLIEAITKYPKILQRPIVIHNGQAAIGRPVTNVLEIL